MRNFPLKFRSGCSAAARFAGLSLLAVFLLIPLSIFATTREVTLNRAHRMEGLRSSHRKSLTLRGHRRHASASIRPRNRRSARSRSKVTRVHLASRHSRRYDRRARVRRYRTDAALDNVRTHTPPTETPTADVEASESSSPLETTRPVVLSVTAAQTENATATHDLPFFNASVPQYMPAALRGSHEVLVHQNIIADVEGLRRIENDSQLSAMVHSGDLVALPASSALFIDSRLPQNRRYCRPWAAKFLSDLSRAHERVFGDPLQLTSAVRTINFQRHLAHYNGNAAPAYGETASPHLTGEAIDIGKKGMSLHEIAWMRAVLGQLQTAGKIDVEEEFEQACFHISIYKTYTPHVTLPPTLVASDGNPSAEDVQTEEAPATTAIGGLVRPVSEPVTRRSWSRRHSYSARSVRHAAIRRRRHRHHGSMALLAARIR